MVFFIGDEIELLWKSDLMGINITLGKLKRFALITLGLICLTLGIIGYVIPGLPGTIWLILAATFFVRSSERLYNFVVQNRFFGRQVREFLETGMMPRRAKIISLTFMWIFSITSVVWAPYSWLFDIPIILLTIIGTIYILTRPTKKISLNIFDVSLKE